MRGERGLGGFVFGNIFFPHFDKGVHGKGAGFLFRIHVLGGGEGEVQEKRISRGPDLFIFLYRKILEKEEISFGSFVHIPFLFVFFPLSLVLSTRKHFSSQIVPIPNLFQSIPLFFFFREKNNFHNISPASSL